MPAGINRAGSRGGNASVMVAAESFERVSALGAKKLGSSTSATCRLQQHACLTRLKSESEPDTLAARRRASRACPHQ
jgi:hypothetical protein